MCGQESDEREQPEQAWRCAGDGEVGPLALGLDTEMRPGLLKGHLHLPAPDEPTQDLFGRPIRISAQQALRLERICQRWRQRALWQRMVP